MSTDATAPTSSAPAGAAPVAPTSTAATTSPSSKGKGKSAEVPVEEEDDDEESDEEDEEEEDEDVMEEDEDDEIDPSVILPGPRRSTRGVRVDYSSAEALAKAGLKPEDLEEDEEQEKSFAAPDDRMEE